MVLVMVVVMCVCLCAFRSRDRVWGRERRRESPERANSHRDSPRLQLYLREYTCLANTGISLCVTWFVE